MDNHTQIRYNIATLINLEINIVHFFRIIFRQDNNANKIRILTTLTALTKMELFHKSA